MHIRVLVSQMEAPAGLREWIGSRLAEVLGAAVTSVVSVAVVMSPVLSARQDGVVRCSLVVTTTQGRRVVETRDAKVEAAVERALRLVSLSLFADPPAVAGATEKPAPPA